MSGGLAEEKSFDPDEDGALASEKSFDPDTEGIISHKVFLVSCFKSQFPHKSVNSFVYIRVSVSTWPPLSMSRYVSRLKPVWQCSLIHSMFSTSNITEFV